MSLHEIHLQTRGEGFYDITDKIHQVTNDNIFSDQQNSGVLYLFNPHTSCSLVINEAFDPTAREDMEKFLNYLAPRNLKFIRHKAEGEDDSPSHMKSILLQQHIALPVEQGKIILGQWQGVYLTEFRDGPHNRRVQLKFMKE